MLDARDAGVFYGSRVSSKALLAAKAALHRAWGLAAGQAAGRSWDVVFVQREAFFLGGPLFEWLASRRAPLILDFDDAIWIHAISRANRRFAFLKNVDKIPALMGMARTVIAGNRYLADWASKHNPNVVVVPTCVDTNRYRPLETSTEIGRPVVIGRMGSASTAEHLERASPILERVKDRYGNAVEFTVVGAPDFRNARLGVVGQAWSSRTEVHALQAIDVGIMPLPDDEWERGKCGLKALTYMAVAIPAVASPGGVNQEIITDGLDGFTPQEPDAWVERLCQLVEDAGLQRRMGLAARRKVVERYSVARWREPLLQIIRQTVAGQHVQVR